jgi:hypothetical protein
MTIQSSRKFARSGRRRKRRKRRSARPMMSATAPMHSSVMRAHLARHPSTARCDKQLVCLDKALSTHNCLPSGTNLQPLATMPLPSTARKVQVYLRAWLSMLLPTATHTTVPIVTAAVTLSRHTAKTLRCTNRVTNCTLERHNHALSG